MVLVDTSVWIDHLQKGSPALSALLETNRVILHSFVIGELACGNLSRRKEILSLLHALPLIGAVENDEVLFFLEKHHLFGKGLALVDIHLLASCFMHQVPLWTRDKRLNAASKHLGLNFSP
ncbi:MAG: PIN domain-containing protein [Verrucomicrobia bacterium]|nr:PIN domain-containing protein [Verrucomicrobiota bacterium]MCH8527905.1 PIN domain-containing protein [Kiritimatiellia bacterium]